jgi:hypothetical protein
MRRRQEHRNRPDDRRRIRGLRQDPARFATVPGHEGDESWARVIDVNDRFAVVEKLGVAGEVARELDPRNAT